MDFKNLVLNDAEDKYREMIGGRTSDPFSGSIQVAASDEYAKRRGRYQERLLREKDEFNNAITEVKARRDSRMSGESRMRDIMAMDRYRSRSSLTVFLIFLAVAASMILLCLAGFTPYVTEELIPAMGWEGVEYIGEGFDDLEYLFEDAFVYFDAYALVLALTVLFTVGIYLGLLILAIVKRDDYGWLLGVLIGGMLLSGLPLLIIFLAVRLIFFLLSFVFMLIFMPIGIPIVCIAGIVLLIIKTREFALNKTKRLNYLFVVILVLAGLIGFGVTSLGLTFENIAIIVERLSGPSDTDTGDKESGSSDGSSDVTGDDGGKIPGSDIEPSAIKVNPGENRSLILDMSTPEVIYTFTPDENCNLVIKVSSDYTLKVRVYLDAETALYLDPSLDIEEGEKTYELYSQQTNRFELPIEGISGVSCYVSIAADTASYPIVEANFELKVE